MRGDVSLEPESTALLIVDMQRLDADPDRALGRLLTRDHPEIAEYFFGRISTTVVPNIQRLLGHFRASGMRVVYIVAASYLPDRSDTHRLRRERDTGRPADGGLSSNQPGDAEVVPEIAPAPGELVLTKNSYSPFNSTGLDQILRNMGICGLVISGVATDISVDMTARDAADRGYESVMVEDGLAAFTPERHVRALETFHWFLGEVASTEEVLARLGAVPASPGPGSL